MILSNDAIVLLWRESFQFHEWCGPKCVVECPPPMLCVAVLPMLIGWRPSSCSVTLVSYDRNLYHASWSILCLLTEERPEILVCKHNHPEMCQRVSLVCKAMLQLQIVQAGNTARMLLLHALFISILWASSIATECHVLPLTLTTNAPCWNMVRMDCGIQSKSARCWEISLQ